ASQLPQSFRLEHDCVLDIGICGSWLASDGVSEIATLRPEVTQIVTHHPVHSSPSAISLFINGI
ncbi:hypothetical protein, partial [Pseudomonas sp. MD195_PC81_125]|uniref:hypothetical protein n=1 Tax=Pseudomonas sp. MD195_PC81_125 TaxID=2741560 RepID=UPI001C716F36